MGGVLLHFSFMPKKTEIFQIILFIVKKNALFRPILGRFFRSQNCYTKKTKKRRSSPKRSPLEIFNNGPKKEAQSFFGKLPRSNV